MQGRQLRVLNLGVEPRAAPRPDPEAWVLIRIQRWMPSVWCCRGPGPGPGTTQRINASRSRRWIRGIGPSAAGGSVPTLRAGLTATGKVHIPALTQHPTLSTDGTCLTRSTALLSPKSTAEPSLAGRPVTAAVMPEAESVPAGFPETLLAGAMGQASRQSAFRV